MKDSNSLESVLRQWTPRSPSARIKRELFGTPAPEPVLGIDLREVVRWLVPAMGCFLLAFASLGTRPAVGHAITSFQLSDGGDALVAKAVYAASDFYTGVNKVRTTVESRFATMPDSHSIQLSTRDAVAPETNTSKLQE